MPKIRIQIGKKKTENYFFPKPLCNKFVKHGIACELLARAAYEENQNVKVIPYGLVVSKQNTWLGYSPDGIVFKDGKPWKLIEIKCPYNGKTMSITDLINNLKWIEITDKKEIIFKNRLFYTQVQIGMAVLHLELTDFIIYSSFDNTFVSFNIELDFNYCKNLFIFKKMLPNLCKMLRNKANKSKKNLNKNL